MRHDAIVIGAGMSGLAAGLRLALLGRSVVVLERHEVWGGLNSFYTLGGRPFDVGLHALTNYVPPRTKGAPLTRILRHLRIRHEELRLGQQGRSEIRLPDLSLSFTNDFARFEEEVGRAFPSERDGFARLVRDVRAFEPGEADDASPGAREVLAGYLRDPLLTEALLLPLCYYGSAREDDVEWRQFMVLFRSIFLEGLARPEGGVRTILNLLVKRLRRAGGELRTRAGVRRILVDGGAVRGVELESGEVLTSDRVLSSAGWPETVALLPGHEPASPEEHGRLSFLESISVLDRPSRELGIDVTTCFWSTRERFRYRRPEGAVDLSSGVVSVPDNFAAERPLREGQVRLTILANHDAFAAMPEADYVRTKQEAADRAVEAVGRFLPDWRPATVFRDVFTPRTIRHFTGHHAGCVYGSPRKRWSGESGVEGLALCGTDQGYLGVVGALLSGITMATRHAVPVGGGA